MTKFEPIDTTDLDKSIAVAEALKRDQLITAAPELLKACEDLYEELVDRYDFDPDRGEGPFNGVSDFISQLERAIDHAGGKLR